MKPLKLVMSAFGSYARETTVDFSQVQQGIFLVTGDTGRRQNHHFRRDHLCPL